MEEVPDDDTESALQEEELEDEEESSPSGSDDDDEVVIEDNTEAAEKEENAPKTKTVMVDEWVQMNAQAPIWTRYAYHLSHKHTKLSHLQ